VSVNTVKWHKANIYRKLGVSGSRPAVDRAVELGVLDAADLP
jgi:ATP/maltotriose-dependent transcriptional regulator MalT